ncbi:MAG: tRNA pseudouridine(13) synthase TruD, partial [Gammaproteobacteria bacterium]|nr:tRNA pseudouridine(13) synthase TruD [Gammaproteobacteria bacterium]
MQSHRPCGVIRERIEDFQVSEELDCDFTDDGEHLYLHVEKTDLNTRDVQEILAEHYRVPSIDVSYAGLKDKRSIAQQWFSVRLPKTSTPPIHPCLKILTERTHSRKLRIGSHLGNHFKIVIRQMSDYDINEMATNLGAPVPNYFGPQRFGREFKNIGRAIKWIERGRPRIERSLRYRHLTTMRSFLFNEVLAERVRVGTWNKMLDGDVPINGYPSGPLWGRGRLPTLGSPEEIEGSLRARHKKVCEALEWVGLHQDRRALSVQPEA